MAGMDSEAGLFELSNMTAFLLRVHYPYVPFFLLVWETMDGHTSEHKHNLLTFTLLLEKWSSAHSCLELCLCII